MIRELWTYRIPRGKYDWGGTLMLSPDGQFIAFTDYGNYMRWWPWDARERKIKDFREFILGLAKSCAQGYCDYLLEKIAREETLDDQYVQRELKICVLKHYRQHLLCRKDHCQGCEFYCNGARNIRHIECATRKFDREWCEDELQQISEIYSTVALSVYYDRTSLVCDFSEVSRNTYDSDAWNFAKSMMPRMVEILEADIAENPPVREVEIA